MRKIRKNFMYIKFYVCIRKYEKNGFEKILDFRFLIELRILRCPELNITIPLENVCLPM